VILDDSHIENSVVLPGARIGRWCHLENCIVDQDFRVPDSTCIKDMIFANEPPEPEDD